MSGLDITPPLPPGRQLIQGYGDGGFRVSGLKYHGSVIVYPERTVAWAVNDHSDITIDAFSSVPGNHELRQILLVGCGRQYLPPPTGLGDRLRERGFALEWMDTGAACRTFNVLLFDDRDVMAALVAVS